MMRYKSFILPILLTFLLSPSLTWAAESRPADLSDTKEESQGAGHEMKEGFKDVGSGIKKGSKKTGHEIKKGSKKAGHEIKNAFD